MDEDIDYAKALEIIKDVEGSYIEQEEEVVSINDIFKNKIEIETPTYEDAAKVMEKVIGKFDTTPVKREIPQEQQVVVQQKQPQSQAKPAARPKKAQQPKPAPAPKAPKEKWSIFKPKKQEPNANAARQKIAKEIPAQNIQIGETMAKAAREIQSQIGNVEKEVSESVEKPAVQAVASESQMVMPTLSVQDQISEMEKISAIMDENTIDKAQIGIIRDELKNLYNVTKSENNDSGNPEIASLIRTRNQRLYELIHKMSIET